MVLSAVPRRVHELVAPWIHSVRPVLSSVMPFLWEFSPRLPLMKYEPRAAKLPCSAASALCPFQQFQNGFRVARVSRLIGKSDTTAKRVGLQVEPIPTQFYRRSGWWAASPQTLETPLPSEWRFAVLRWSLASQAFEDGGYIHRAFCRFSWPVSPFEGPLQWRCLLPGPAVLWAGRDLFQQPVHHWHP